MSQLHRNQYPPCLYRFIEQVYSGHCTNISNNRLNRPSGRLIEKICMSCHAAKAFVFFFADLLSLWADCSTQQDQTIIRQYATPMKIKKINIHDIFPKQGHIGDVTYAQQVN